VRDGGNPGSFATTENSLLVQYCVCLRIVDSASKNDPIFCHRSPTPIFFAFFAVGRVRVLAVYSRTAQ